MRKPLLTLLTALATLSIASLPSLASADSLAAGTPTTLLTIDSAYATGFGGLTAIRFLPDGRLLVAEKAGALKIRHTDGTIVTAYTFPVNTTSEQGLLGVAPFPDFATSKRIAVYWSRNAAAGGTDQDRHRVASYVLNGDVLDFTSEKILVDKLLGPANHDGGALSFGPDGMLYVGTGDTGCNMTPPAPPTLHNNLLGTSFNVANGKVLRVNPTGAAITNPWTGATNVSGVTLPYACGATAGSSVPKTTQPARPEIFATGFRNAFRIWVDPLTGNVWVGDVGESTFEEIDIVPKAGGRHYGWPFIEGPVTTATWPITKCTDLSPTPGDCAPPAYFCHHGAATTVNGAAIDGSCTAITGGVILDGCGMPAALRGRYVFGDSSNGVLWTLGVNGTRDGLVGPRADFATISGGPVETTMGPDGALYVAVYGGGTTSHVTRIAAKMADPTCGAGGDAGTDAGADTGADTGVDSSAGDAGADTGAGDTGADASVADTGAASDTGVSADTASGDDAATSDAADDTGAANDGGADPVASDSGGCGCRTSAPRDTATWGLAAIGMAIAIAARRRR
jgi:MYXO-CTERM domain-containing protein